MLTGDLIRVRQDGDELVPGYLQGGSASLREQAGDLLDIARQAADEQWRRGRLEDELDALIGEDRNLKLLKGIVKTLLDRGTFEINSPVPPVELRDRVFRLARERGPIALEPGPMDRVVAKDILAEVGASLGLTAAQVSEALYADRREEERLIALDVPDAAWLLRRYDLGLAQALLLHASEVRIVLQEPTALRLRQLFRWIKFCQLVHTATRKGEELHVTLDGPLSLFQQSTKYGMQLATFLPALLLQAGPWKLEASILWTKANLKRRLVVTDRTGLTTYLQDTGVWESRERQFFAERFAAYESPWTMTDGAEPLDLGGRAVVLPDFTFTDGTRTGHLEIVGFWRKEWLASRLELLQKYGPGNLILAVSRKLAGSKEKLADFPGEVIDFAEIVPPKAVVAALERVAR